MDTCDDSPRRTSRTERRAAEATSQAVFGHNSAVSANWRALSTRRQSPKTIPVSFQFTLEQREELLTDVPALLVDQLESRVADILRPRISGPDPEITANMKRLHAFRRRVSRLRRDLEMLERDHLLHADRLAQTLDNAAAWFDARGITAKPFRIAARLSAAQSDDHRHNRADVEYACVDILQAHGVRTGGSRGGRVLALILAAALGVRIDSDPDNQKRAMIRARQSWKARRGRPDRLEGLIERLSRDGNDDGPETQ